MRAQRRQFLAGGLATLGGLVAGPARSAIEPLKVTPVEPLEDTTLPLYHIHTTEKLTIPYREHGVVIEEALAEINHLLRDFRTGQEEAIDVDLLDTLSLLYEHFGRRGHYEIVSGYRSPRTNKALRKVTTGVAEDSLHIYGRAIDVRFVGAETADLRDAAIELSRGGVGFYPESNFVHLDTGRVRYW